MPSIQRAGIASRSALRHFEYESQLLARLRHNGIAQVYDAGTHRDGDVTVPYFAMEYIVGASPITEYVVQEKVSTRERMKLFVEAYEAVHHGHQKGIIHRDLKPSNILVDSSGQMKIIDFGVAHSTDSDMAVTTLQTDLGQLIGTLPLFACSWPLLRSSAIDNNTYHGPRSPRACSRAPRTPIGVGNLHGLLHRQQIRPTAQMNSAGVINQRYCS